MNNLKPGETRAVNPDTKLTTKVVSGSVGERKKSLGEKITSTFIAEDTKSIRNHVSKNILIPALKSMVVDSLTSAVESIFGVRRNARGGYNSPYQQPVATPYNSQPYNKPVAHSYATPRNRYNEWLYETYQDADNVLERMCAIIDKYNFVSIMDYNDASGKSSLDQTDIDWGWVSLGDAFIVEHHGGGYSIKLPTTLASRRR